MVIDTSAVVAIVLREPDRARFADAIDESDSRLLSTATALEASIMLEKNFAAEGRGSSMFFCVVR
jgi:ribonuclease VapC